MLSAPANVAACTKLPLYTYKRSDINYVTPTNIATYAGYTFTRSDLYLTVPHGKFGSPYLGKVQQEQRYPFLSVCAVFSCVQTMVWLPVFGIFNVRTDVDACDCIRGLYGHRKRVCTES